MFNPIVYDSERWLKLVLNARNHGWKKHKNDIFVSLLTLTVPIRDEDRKLTQILFSHLFAVPEGGS